jgi:DNA-binding response OmpR family regulator
MAKHILLISADQRQATRVQVALLRYGCMVEIAGTFRRGLAVIEHRPPAAIVIDETLPDLDSHLLARVLEVSAACAGPAVVMLPLHTSATSQVVEMVCARARQSSDTRLQPAFGRGDAWRV